MGNLQSAVHQDREKTRMKNIRDICHAYDSYKKSITITTTENIHEMMSETGIHPSDYSIKSYQIQWSWDWTRPSYHHVINFRPSITGVHFV